MARDNGIGLRIGGIRGTVAVEVEGQKRVVRMLKDLQGNAVDMLPAMLAAGQAVQEETDRLWAGPRKPLAPSTVARKRRQGLPTTPLDATGETKVAASVIDVTPTVKGVRFRVDPPQSVFQFDKGRPVLPPTKRIASIVMREAYRHLDVDKP